MKQFLFTGISVLAIVGTALLVLIFFIPPNYKGFMASIIDKHKMLDETQMEPRIIIIGGSNALFGVDSEEISKRLGKPVVNMSIHAGLGLKFMLDEIEPHLQPSDIVIIVPEYSHFFGNDINGEGLRLLQIAEVYPEAIKIMNAGHYWKVAQSSMLYLQKKITRMAAEKLNIKMGDTERFYRREGFNRYGDIVSHLNEETQEGAQEKLQLHLPVGNAAIDALNDFVQSASAKGAVCLFMFPCLSEENFNLNKEAVTLLNQKISNDLKMQVVGNPSDFVYPENFFFDTAYHLNRKGRSSRTNKMIFLLSTKKIPDSFSESGI